MKLDVTQTLKQLNGDVILDNDGKGGVQEATLRAVVINAVLSPVEKESGVDKVKKYQLASCVFNKDEVDFTAEEITLIKERVGSLYAPLIVGQVFEMLGA